LVSGLQSHRVLGLLGTVGRGYTLADVGDGLLDQLPCMAVVCPRVHRRGGCVVGEVGFPARAEQGVEIGVEVLRADEKRRNVLRPVKLTTMNTLSRAPRRGVRRGGHAHRPIRWRSGGALVWFVDHRAPSDARF
jgi:hypothetical protein